MVLNFHIMKERTMARPKIQIDAKQVQDLASVGCKTTEIARLLDCSADTIERRFAGELRKGRENLKISLRQWQLAAAKKGNVVMLIWLGKQYLGQSDTVSNEEDYELTTEFTRDEKSKSKE